MRTCPGPGIGVGMVRTEAVRVEGVRTKARISPGGGMVIVFCFVLMGNIWLRVFPKTRSLRRGRSRRSGHQRDGGFLYLVLDIGHDDVTSDISTFCG
jgi:hypothetical protein